MGRKQRGFQRHVQDSCISYSFAAMKMAGENGDYSAGTGSASAVMLVDEVKNILIIPEQARRYCRCGEYGNVAADDDSFAVLTAFVQGRCEQIKWWE